MRSEITYLFWFSYVVFLSSAWKTVGMTISGCHANILPSIGQENNVALFELLLVLITFRPSEQTAAISVNNHQSIRTNSCY